MPADAALCFRTVMASPSMTSRQLLMDMRRISDQTHAFSNLQDPRITDVRKSSNSIRISVSFSQYIAGYGQVHGAGMADVTATQMSLVVAASPNAAKARERLRLGQ